MHYNYIKHESRGRCVRMGHVWFGMIISALFCILFVFFILPAIISNSKNLSTYYFIPGRPPILVRKETKTNLEVNKEQLSLIYPPDVWNIFKIDTKNVKNLKEILFEEFGMDPKNYISSQEYVTLRKTPRKLICGFPINDELDTGTSSASPFFFSLTVYVTRAHHFLI